MRSADYRQEYETCRMRVEQALDTYFQQQGSQKELLDAMRYSLLAGGKRIRPVLLLKFCEASGGRTEQALPFACGVEMLHTYSLIHDDLPCMDNDCLRRGKPTNHMVYGECTATLAGDALQAAAFHTVLSAPLAPEAVAQAGLLLAQAAGPEGICGGQYLDMEAEGKELTREALTEIHHRKTASMLRAAAMMGVIAAGGRVQEVQAQAADQYAGALGLAFQIRDDMLNYTSSAETLGKPVGSDSQRGKSTFVSLLGLEGCEELVRSKTEEAKLAIRGNFADTGFLEWLADFLAHREN